MEKRVKELEDTVRMLNNTITRLLIAHSSEYKHIELLCASKTIEDYLDEKEYFDE